MSGPPLDARAALENLVNQFSDPLSFYRELIQNALDAGSAEIDVRLEFQGPPEDSETPNDPKAQGLTIVHVDDYGEGMNRRIIDTRLTRLFSSAKDGDFTKIGRFGIGFVSVFAIEPDAVVVDTSRDGENWRVLFEGDRTFSRIERPEPVEGTKIRIYKEMTRADFDTFRERSLEIIRFWTRHAAAEIRFDDESIGEPFSLVDVPIEVRDRAEGTEIVAGYHREFEPFFGFYNRGLTLLEGEAGFIDDLAFKVDSRHLEHTLTRDNVLRDEGFEKAMNAVERLTRAPLRSALFTAAEARLEQGEQEILDHCLLALVHHTRQYSDRLTGAERERRIFQRVDGEPIPLEVVLDAAREGRLLHESIDSPLAEAVRSQGWLVIQAGRGRPAHRALRALSGKPVERLRRRWCLPLIEPDPPTGWPELSSALLDLLAVSGARLAGTRVARFRYPGSMIRNRVAITQETPGEPTPMDETRRLASGFFAAKRTLVLNLDHPLVGSALALASTEPEMAAFTLLRIFHLPAGLAPEIESRLIERVLQQR